MQSINTAETVNKQTVTVIDKNILTLLLANMQTEKAELHIKAFKNKRLKVC